MGSVAAALLFASAIYSHSFDINHVRSVEMPDGGCDIFAQADDGPLLAKVKWAPCREIDVRVMSAAELEKAGQLESLGMIGRVFMLKPNRVFITAWSSHAAALYARARRGEAATVEITLAD